MSAEMKTENATETSPILGKRKRAGSRSYNSLKPHPYLVGNFAPIQRICPLTPCRYTGTIPDELVGGEYVRNGSNPVSNEDLGREAHWFDGDGMLSGVSFTRSSEVDAEGHRKIEPQFVNQYILTDVYLSGISTPTLRRPILPSIATLVNPVSSLFRICFFVFRTILLVILSRLPGSKQAIKKISVSNTSIMYHDGRALATCESGPPMRISLPELETVGWFDGNRAEGEPEAETEANLEKDKQDVLGGKGVMSFMKEWTTAHPKVDPISGEMILFHSTFAPPYVHYSVLPSTSNGQTGGSRMLNKPVAGVSSAKMMHDFGVSRHHTVIMDLPLTLDPLQMMKNKPPIMYDCTKPSRFGVFPRHDSSNVRWFETTACCIFHTANTWDVFDDSGNLSSVDMLACRMTSASVVFNAGNIAAPVPTTKTVRQVVKTMPEKLAEELAYDNGPHLESHDLQRIRSIESSISIDESEPGLYSPYEDEQCRLYYFSFDMKSRINQITKQFALSAIPFEFPSVRQDMEMQPARFVYGCTTIHGTFNSSLGRDAKLDGIVKFDTQELLKRAREKPPTNVIGCVDPRSASEIVSSSGDGCENDAIQIFRVPDYHFAQEPRFVPAQRSRHEEDVQREDDGYLLTYMFDERQLTQGETDSYKAETLEAPLTAISELWIIDARSMKHVLAKIQLPQRVPYGLHGNWFSADQVSHQRAVERVRSRNSATDGDGKTRLERMCQKLSHGIITAIGG